MEPVKRKNRYGDTYYFEKVSDGIYKFVISGTSMQWCRFGGNEGEQGIDYNNLGMFDPSGGPFVSRGYLVEGQPVVRIFKKDEDVFVKVLK